MDCPDFIYSLFILSLHHSLLNVFIYVLNNTATNERLLRRTLVRPVVLFSM